jgi:hypothetical protein
VNIKVKIKILAIHAIIDGIDKEVSADKGHLGLTVRLLYMSCFDRKIIQNIKQAPRVTEETVINRINDSRTIGVVSNAV